MALGPGSDTSVSSRRRWKFKTVLHFLTLLASLISISLFASSIPLWNANFFHNRGPRGDFTDGLTLGPLAFTFIVTSTQLAYTFIKRQPFPPKVTIATTSLILLSLAATLVLAGQGSLFRVWQPDAIRPQSGIVQCNLMNIFTRDCEPILYQIGEAQIGAIAFGTMTWLLVFIAFLVSLYEHRASQVENLRKGSHSRGLRRLTLMAAGQRSYTDVEKGTPWTGSGSSHSYSHSHSHTSSNGSRSSQRSREHRHERRREHRQDGTNKHYRSGVKDGSGDTVPFVYVQEPAKAHHSYPHPGTRYM